MNRTYFYLRDSITGKYHVDTHNNLGDFDKAVTFLSEKNAANGRKGRVLGYEQWVGWGKPTKKEPTYKHCLSKWNGAVQRTKLPNCGIEIVAATISEPTKNIIFATHLSTMITKPRTPTITIPKPHPPMGTRPSSVKPTPTKRARKPMGKNSIIRDPQSGRVQVWSNGRVIGETG